MTDSDLSDQALANLPAEEQTQRLIEEIREAKDRALDKQREQFEKRLEEERRRKGELEQQLAGVEHDRRQLKSDRDNWDVERDQLESALKDCNETVREQESSLRMYRSVSADYEKGSRGHRAPTAPGEEESRRSAALMDSGRFSAPNRTGLQSPDDKSDGERYEFTGISGRMVTKCQCSGRCSCESHAHGTERHKSREESGDLGKQLASTPAGGLKPKPPGVNFELSPIRNLSSTRGTDASQSQNNWTSLIDSARRPVSPSRTNGDVRNQYALCHVCLKAGHQGKDCPDKENYAPQGRNRSYTICYHCRERGHGIADCPARDSHSGRNRSRDGSRDRNDSSRGRNLKDYSRLYDRAAATVAAGGGGGSGRRGPRARN